MTDLSIGTRLQGTLPMLCEQFLSEFEDCIPGVAQDYERATPFPHAVIDCLFQDGLIQRLLYEFPLRFDPIWQNYDEDVQVKQRTRWHDERDIEPDTLEVVRTLNSGRFLRALSRLTGIPHLIADPYLTGGGLCAVHPGGYLDIHCDGNWHDEMRLKRRLNVILYLNYGWRSNGELTLYDRQLNPVKEIPPFANRLVVFTTDETSFHGHPEPLVCAAGESRKSLILYYYSADPVDKPHRALWRKRGQI